MGDLVIDKVAADLLEVASDVPEVEDEDLIQDIPKEEEEVKEEENIKHKEN